MAFYTIDDPQETGNTYLFNLDQVVALSVEVGTGSPNQEFLLRIALPGKEIVLIYTSHADALNAHDAIANNFAIKNKAASRRRSAPPSVIK